MLFVRDVCDVRDVRADSEACVSFFVISLSYLIVIHLIHRPPDLSFVASVNWRRRFRRIRPGRPSSAELGSFLLWSDILEAAVVRFGDPFR